MSSQGGQDAHNVHSHFAFERYSLKNGVQVLMQRDDRAPIVSMQTWCRAGSAVDPRGKTGMAHLFEHLMFTGTAAVPDGELDRQIESLGGRINAATWLDWTYFYVDAPATALGDVLRLESDRYQGLILESDRVETEREIVLNERRECVDNDPDGQLSELLWSRAFSDHPYGHPTIGWEDDIRSISLDDCRKHYQRWYAADQTILTIAGQFEPEALLRDLSRLYGELRPSGHQIKTPAIQSITGSQPITVSLPIAGERILMGFIGPPMSDVDHAALDVLNEILMEGESARLFNRLINEQEVAASAYGFLPTLKWGCLYEIGVDLRPGESSGAVIDTIQNTLGDIIQHGPKPEELTKAQNRLETRFFVDLQTAQQRAQAMGNWEVVLQAEAINTRAERLRKIDVDDVIKAARRYLRPELSHTVIAQPEQP